MTGLARVTLALQEIGVVGAGQTPTSEDATFALGVLQRMFTGWAAERLMVPSILRTVVSLVSGTRDYTIGSGGDIAIVRPVSIFRARVVLDSTLDPPVESPIAVFDDAQWAAVASKTLEAGAIDGVYYDHAFSSTERGTISTYPTINVSGVQLVLYTPQAVVGYVTLTEDLAFPPAWDDAVLYRLARKLCRPFGRTVTPDLERDERDAIAVVKRTNLRPDELSCGPMFTGGVAGNIYTGEGA
jgi:hypothetical protein